MKKILAMLGLALLLSALPVWAHSVTLTWTPSPSIPPVGTGWSIGYLVFEAESPTAFNWTIPLNNPAVAVGCTSSSNCTYTDLTCNTLGQTCYYAVEAAWVGGSIDGAQPWYRPSVPSNVVWCMIGGTCSENPMSPASLTAAPH